MTVRWANIKKLAVMAAMAAGVAAAGLGFGSGTAQASPAATPTPHHNIFNGVDRVTDRHEGGFIDRVFDRFEQHKVTKK
ncbi:hypothetical protein [Mycobacterium sp.]|jgi:hypothetical protein|uniref:hypothetical protein n=1 Tax=Mycobacterium sp. TaxID=1785 RepID=UPI002D49820C|nr:hypothetical protein [Mycobacterium sp.]HZA09877.1 hypothetical protein [Mycobacterium sp.]